MIEIIRPQCCNQLVALALALALALVLGFILTLLTPLLGHAQALPDVAIAIQKLNADLTQPAAVQYSAVTGLVRSMRFAEGDSLALPGILPTVNPANAALAFMADFGPAFGVADRDNIRVLATADADAVGMSHVRLQQQYEGIPVSAGEVSIHLRGNQVVSVLADTLPDLDGFDTTPAITAVEALASARALIEKYYAIIDANYSTPSLVIFNRGLLTDRQSPTRLAWFIEATRIDVRELIWIDAQQGGVLLNFSQLTDAKPA
ncbi:MAG: hypothetical protein R3F53_12635 [Gammaproteobacteria bacterium]